uniref:Uncharacterized protein n=1 Tax=Ciona savignyi TaxID=51511 RepID=H2YSC7_CIOSA
MEKTLLVLLITAIGLCCIYDVIEAKRKRSHSKFDLMSDESKY